MCSDGETIRVGLGIPPNTAWSRRPPLRFNEVALPAVVVGDSGLVLSAGAGGLKWLTPTVRYSHVTLRVNRHGFAETHISPSKLVLYTGIFAPHRSPLYGICGMLGCR